MMKMVSIKILVSVLAGLSSVNALDFNLRGKDKAGQFSCTISGADNQDTCDVGSIVLACLYGSAFCNLSEVWIDY